MHQTKSAQPGNFELTKSLFSFQGRMRRLHYGWISLISTFSYASLWFFLALFLRASSDLVSFMNMVGIMTLMIIPVTWVMMAISVKRLHDIGYSGFYVLLLLVPYLNLLFYIALVLKDGTEGPNEYGPDPKDRIGLLSTRGYLPAIPATVPSEHTVSSKATINSQSGVDDVRLTILADAVSIPVVPIRVDIFFNGELIDRTTTKKGIDSSLMFSIKGGVRGRHIMRIKCGFMGVFTGTTSWPLTFVSPGAYIVRVKYSVWRGGYAKKSFSISGPEPILQAGEWVDEHGVRKRTNAFKRTEWWDGRGWKLVRPDQGASLPSTLIPTQLTMPASAESTTLHTSPAPVSATAPVTAPALASAPTIEAPADLASTDSGVAARFKLGALVAEGGMAHVFKATEKGSGRQVIWKQAHGIHNSLNNANLSVEREAAFLSEVNHPRIPKHIDRGSVVSDGQEQAVLVMDMIEGGDLKQDVATFSKVGASFPAFSAIELICNVIQPLEYLLTISPPVYHRDLKPHNIILHPQQGPMVIDWGLAKAVETGSDISVTRGGSGTWTAPERDAGVSGPFTDVYSLGKVLYYLLTSKMPPAILDREEVTSRFTRRGQPDWLAELVVWACWPQHGKRIQSVTHLRILIENEGVWPEAAGVAGSMISGAAASVMPGSVTDEPARSEATSDDYTTWG